MLRESIELRERAHRAVQIVIGIVRSTRAGHRGLAERAVDAAIVAEVNDLRLGDGEPDAVLIGMHARGRADGTASVDVRGVEPAGGAGCVLRGDAALEDV